MFFPHSFSFLHKIIARNIQLETNQFKNPTLIYYIIKDPKNQEIVYKSEKLFLTENPSWLPLENTPKIEKDLYEIKFEIYAEKECIFEQKVKLNYLHFLCNKFSEFQVEFPRNTLIFQFQDGFYVLSKNAHEILEKSSPISQKLKANEKSQIESRIPQITKYLQTYHSFSLLKKETRSLKQELGNKISETNEFSDQFNTLTEKLLKIRKSKSIYIFKKKKYLEEKKKIMERKDKIQPRAEKLFENISNLKRGRENLFHEKEELNQINSERVTIISSIVARKEYILQDLRSIFPIKEISGQVGLSIAGVKLPNSSYESYDEEMVSTGFGYVALLLLFLSKYLELPLRYKIIFQGSRSSIQDDVSERGVEYPLFLKGKTKEKFLIGVKFLNKNIEQILHSRNLNIISSSHTLANLLTLMSSGNFSTQSNNQSNLKTFHRNLSIRPEIKLDQVDSNFSN
ncbi:uv radiation resistance-associated protein [Anaeramoeba ignava]|uniref:Uv radiation resistance-associated protein n=1 Tax=Anaeramoeba ignava TaxID=1746090 RepID=A0A9Q0LSB6_ANAIG|nr:uv radiation resistance-associated protein [Anaeramoeba ignava]